MASDGKAARRALRSAIESWFWRSTAPEPALAEAAPSPTVRTELSSTVFSGDARDWVNYLQLGEERRYELDVVVAIHLQPDLHLIAFEPETEPSRWLGELLTFGFRELMRRLEAKPHVLKVFRQLVFDNKANRNQRLRVVLSPHVPSDGTREARSHDNDGSIVRLVLSSTLARSAQQRYEQSLGQSNGEKLGAIWGVVSRLVCSLAYPAAPRDLFVTKIDIHSKLTYVAVNVLFDDQKRGVLSPTVVGKAFSRVVSEATDVPVADLHERDPYFRSLNKVGFMLRAGAYKGYEDDARIVSREFLDPVYLRLSLAGAMPDVLPTMQSMRPTRSGGKLKTPEPELGRYGILDAEDFEAWKTVATPFADQGFTLVKQLGMGEFGRVYEAINDNNREFPERVALKVDRILGKKKKAILEAEEAMRVGRALAASPHVIRLYDTGKLSGQRFTYHILQLIDGDTLDNLIGVTGREHASVSRPPSARGSELEARLEYARAVDARAGELWRRQRIASPFTQVLSPGMVLDLLTSVLLWLEEVHNVGYANNDLKNGNLMMSRRGQLKGIDLDSYSVTHSPKDKMTDFMFLAVSLVLLLFSAPITNRGRNVPWEELIDSEERLRAGLAAAWPFGDVAALSQGRVTVEELTNLLVDLVQRSRHLVYAKQPQLFSSDIVRLMDLKRRLLIEEFVID
jgi:hypothetical protein